MARYNVSFGDIDLFKEALSKFNPKVNTVTSINGAPAVKFGMFNNVALTFDSSMSKLPKSDKVRVAKDFADKRHTFFVSKNYQCVPFNAVADTILKTIEDKYGYSPRAAYAQFNPGRIQFVLDYDNQLKVDVEQLDLIPFEKAVKNTSILDYAIPNNPKAPAERYTTSIYGDVGFNGRTGIILYPAFIRMICSNLIISLQRLVKTDTIKHLGQDILEKITMNVDESTTILSDQYKKIVDVAVFFKWIEKFYGKKAIQYVTDLEFRDEVKKNFRLYYALQVVTLLNRGIDNDDYKIKGYGLGPKTALAQAQVARMAQAA